MSNDTEIEMVDVESSNIAAVGYNRGTTRIKFKSGKVFDYAAVRRAVYDNMIKSDSVGKFFNKEIKGKYESTEISTDQTDDDSTTDEVGDDSDKKPEAKELVSSPNDGDSSDDGQASSILGDGVADNAPDTQPDKPIDGSQDSGDEEVPDVDDEDFEPQNYIGGFLRSLVEITAEHCHEANKEYCKTLGDDTQVSWNDAPEWQKQSAINGVVLHLQDLTDGKEPLPERSHESWLSEKLLDGWVYGEVKDADKKTHPCCVPYSDLPDDQKQKDVIFIETVKNCYFEKFPDEDATPDITDDELFPDQETLPLCGGNEVSEVIWEDDCSLTIGYGENVVNYSLAPKGIYNELIRAEDQTVFARNRVASTYVGKLK